MEQKPILPRKHRVPEERCKRSPELLSDYTIRNSKIAALLRPSFSATKADHSQFLRRGWLRDHLRSCLHRSEAVARYFFNMHDGISIPDTEGSEHPTIESARTEAVESIAEQLKGSLLKNANVSAWLMNVTDEQGYTVMVLSFTAAVQTTDPVRVATATTAAS